MKQVKYGPAEFSRDISVSRETLERLQAYIALLGTWNRKINLVAKSTWDEVWNRHILDSAQLFNLIPRESRTLVDLGSGAGFPGLVLAIMGARGVHLIESDQRKAAFLREAARMAGVDVSIHSERIEDLKPFPVDVITARALAPLAELLDWAFPFLGPGARCLFLKGQNVEVELTDAHKRWSIRVDQKHSLTDPRAMVLCIDEVRPCPNLPSKPR